MNGIIIDGNVYESLKGECRKECAFYDDVKKCAYWRDYCEAHDCYLRFSPQLTSKLKD